MNKEQERLLDKGLMLPVVEEFYSLQGEGLQAGKPAAFVRIGGCDVGCEWCDSKESWNPSMFPPKPIEAILEQIQSYPASAVVITGGEPLSWNLDPLCALLKKHHIETYIETSGSQPMSGKWDWICLSPKKNSPPLDEVFEVADELKMIIHDETDFGWAESNSALANPDCALLLQPEWSKKEIMLPLIIAYILKNQQWRLSLQTHKWVRIP